jgi:hypothetical protein
VTRIAFCIASALVLTALSPVAFGEIVLRDGAYHVFPADSLQEAVNRAADDPKHKRVIVHEGTYAPVRPAQALVYLHRHHEGVQLIGLGRPTLTAANATIADPAKRSSPAVVNHIFYLGDGLSTNTLVQGFRLTGANHFVNTADTFLIEPDQSVRKGRFYYGDGGAIKVYHRSYPVLRDLEIFDNFASPCAGGISIQHEGATNGMVQIENCIFRNNRAEVTGAALDLLWGSSARVVNCLFEGNVSNTGPGEGENPFNNNGAITVFPRSRLILERCTLTGNRNGVDDQSGLGQFLRCVVRGNTRDGGFTAQPRYELDLPKGGLVQDCVIQGPIRDPLSVVDRSRNRLTESTEPHLEDAGVGYQPTPKAVTQP